MRSGNIHTPCLHRCPGDRRDKPLSYLRLSPSLLPPLLFFLYIYGVLLLLLRIVALFAHGSLNEVAALARFADKRS